MLRPFPGRPGPLRRLWCCAALLTLLAAPQPATARPEDGPRVTACTAADAPAGPRLHVTVTGARRVAGNITITVYGPKPERFLASHAYLARQRVPLRTSSAEACFALAEPGIYAVAVYHDENDDHNFNRSLLGLPSEGYGFSNDAPTSVGLPSFDSVRFTVPPGESRMTIRLRY